MIKLSQPWCLEASLKHQWTGHVPSPHSVLNQDLLAQRNKKFLRKPFTQGWDILRRAIYAFPRLSCPVKLWSPGNWNFYGSLKAGEVIVWTLVPAVEELRPSDKVTLSGHIVGETGAETIEKGLEMGRVTPPPGPLAYGYFSSSPLWELHSRSLVTAVRVHLTSCCCCWLGPFLCLSLLVCLIGLLRTHTQ